MRRGVVLLAMLVLALPAAAQQSSVTRVAGTVTAQNYPGLAAFLQENIDAVVALDVTFPASGAYAGGALVAEKEGDLFVSYVAGGDTQISASTGFVESGSGYVFDRFYKVTFGGMGQGIVALYVEPTLPPGVPVTRVSIDELPETGRN